MKGVLVPPYGPILVVFPETLIDYQKYIEGDLQIKQRIPINGHECTVIFNQDAINLKLETNPRMTMLSEFDFPNEVCHCCPLFGKFLIIGPAKYGDFTDCPQEVIDYFLSLNPKD